MVRKKNALTGHFIGPASGETATLELAKYIITVTNDRGEEVEETAFYDGDGTPVKDITSISFAYSFEGYYDAEDAAQALIAAMEFKTGDETKINYKQIRTDGKHYMGKATVTNIQITGGEASAWAPFVCTITWDQIPDDVTPAP